MFRILVAALAVVWLAVPAGAAPIHFSFYSDDGVCQFGWGDTDTFDCHADLTITMDSADSGQDVFLDQSPGNFGGWLNITTPDGTFLDQTWVGTDWFGVPGSCGSQCAVAQMDHAYELASFFFASTGFGFLNMNGGLTRWDAYGQGRLDLVGGGTWTSIIADKSSVIPLPASGLALVTALFGLAWRRRA